MLLHENRESRVKQKRNEKNQNLIRIISSHKNSVRHPILVNFFFSSYRLNGDAHFFFSNVKVLLGRFQWERKKTKGFLETELSVFKCYVNCNPDISIWHNDLCNNNEWVGFGLKCNHFSFCLCRTIAIESNTEKKLYTENTE